MRKIYVHADYDLKIIRHVIDAKMMKGVKADGEIELYEAWTKYPDYKKADERNINKGVYKPLKIKA